MKAETESGEIITLPKECNCADHNEPHWVWMDKFTDNDLIQRRKRLLEIAEKPPESWTADERTSAMIAAFLMRQIASEQAERLSNKLKNMKRLGIVRLIPEPSDSLNDLQKEKIAQHVAAMCGSGKPAAEPAENLDDKRIRIERKAEQLSIGF